jgi:hypothetical protein
MAHPSMWFPEAESVMAAVHGSISLPDLRRSPQEQPGGTWAPILERVHPPGVTSIDACVAVGTGDGIDDL